jgi:hypothetical protein
MIILPDETILVLNGASFGSEGCSSFAFSIPSSLLTFLFHPDGWESWHNGTWGQSYARDPVYRPTVYNASKPFGSRWDTTTFENSTIPRLYHSGALLLPDGAVFVAGSSPSADVITEANNASYPYKFVSSLSFRLILSADAPSHLAGLSTVPRSSSTSSLPSLL